MGPQISVTFRGFPHLCKTLKEKAIMVFGMDQKSFSCFIHLAEQKAVVIKMYVLNVRYSVTFCAGDEHKLCSREAMN